MESISLISIIVPVYNTSIKRLNKCIDSLLVQTFTDLEILIIDDGSKKEYRAELAIYEQKDERIRVILLENNVGAPAARNQAISFAHGDYLMFVDSDDTVNYYTCELLFHNLMESGADMAIGDFVVTVDDSINRKLKPNNDYELLNTQTAISYLLTNHGFGSTVCCRLAKREIWGEKPFNERLIHEDIASMWQIIAKCKTICHIKNVVYYYFQGDSSSVHGKEIKERFCEDYLKALVFRKNGLNDLRICSPVDLACSFLIHCPSIYVYGQNIKNQKESKKIREEARILFNEHWNLGKECDLISTRQKLHIYLFRVSPFLYCLIFELFRAIKGRRI